LERASRIWQDETAREGILNDVDYRETLITQVGFCARLVGVICISNLYSLFRNATIMSGSLLALQRRSKGTCLIFGAIWFFTTWKVGR
jgi:hypothetical protein